MAITVYPSTWVALSPGSPKSPRIVLIQYHLQGILNTNNDVDFEEAWKALELALHAMHTKNAASLSFEQIYRHAYKIVLKKKAEAFYDRLQNFEHNWLSNKIRTGLQTLVTPPLLGRTGSSVSGGSINELRAAGERFLKGCKDAWDDHQLVMNMATDVFMYLVRQNAGREACAALANSWSGPNTQ